MVQRIAVTLNPAAVADLDQWIREGRYRNLSGAIQSGGGFARQTRETESFRARPE
jgi:Arc/MetJ-type ribon-helix-helix transcriptional regulator